jgi:outer membrane lipoprotein SlyB
MNSSVVTVLSRTAAIVMVTLLIGCSTMDNAYRGTVKVVNPDKMTLQTDLKWMTPPTSMGLRQVGPDRMVVYLRFKNSSGAPVPNLYERIRGGLEQAGYRVTSNPEEAHFTVVTDVRYFGENREKDGGASILTGAVLGGATGAVVGHNIGSGYGTEGAVAGAVVGGALGNVMANRNKMVEIALAVDIRIGERIQGGVRTVRRGDESSAVTHADLVDVGGGGEGGRSSSGTSDDQRAEVTDDFLFHSNRIVTTGTKMGLTADEALPVLSDRLSLALSSVLP